MDEELILSSLNKSLNLSYETVMKTFVRPDKSHLLIFSLRQNYFFFGYMREGGVFANKKRFE